MTDYQYDMDLVVDPLNPANVVANGQVYFYDPSDVAGTSPIALKDPAGLPLPNPLTSNAHGFIPPRSATIPQVMWKSGGFTGYFNSYKGLRDEAVAARSAAESAGATAAAAATAGVAPVTAAADAAAASAAASATAAAASAALVGAPADTAIAAAVSAAGSATKTALGADYSPVNGGDTLNRRALSLNKPTFDGSFAFSKISSNQDGLIAVKDLTVTGGFGGQVGQGGAISYFKAVGIAAHHSGAGNYDHIWGSLYHDGTREAGMFIADITARRGGNAYGGHFRVTSNNTAPAYHVGLAIENIPNVAKGAQVSKVLGAGIAANTPTTTVTLTTAEQFTDGTNLSFVAGDSSIVVAYVNGTMGAPSTSIPVTSFTTASAIANGSNVTVGVNSTYLGLDIQNNGSHSMSAGIAVSHHGTAATPYVFGLSFDSSAASASATAIMIGGSWGSGLNMNANSIVQAGSITGVGTSPNRDVRLVDNLLVDNARHIKFKDSAGAAQKAIGATSSNNMRFIRIASGTQWEFYDEAQTTLLASIKASGRADFSFAGVTTKYTSGGTQPAFLTNGHVEVWHDTGSGNDYLIVNSGGFSKKVALT